MTTAESGEPLNAGAQKCREPIHPENETASGIGSV